MRPSKPGDRVDNFWYMMQVLAAGRTLEGGDEWAFRKITREYAEKFNERLSDVRKMPFQDVLIEVLESRLDGVKRSDLLEFVRELMSDQGSEERARAERDAGAPDRLGAQVHAEHRREPRHAADDRHPDAGPLCARVGRAGRGRGVDHASRHGAALGPHRRPHLPR